LRLRFYEADAVVMDPDNGSRHGARHPPDLH
jgi:hypothetical protein